MKNYKIKNMMVTMILVLIAAMALILTGCGNKAAAPEEAAATEELSSELGEGATDICVEVVDKEGNTSDYTVHTDETVLLDALKEVGLIDGEEQSAGFYVKDVAGMHLDYDKDGMYWAFYINDEYAMTGVDSTEVEADAHYAFKAEQ